MFFKGCEIFGRKFKGYENFPENDKGYENFLENYKGYENFPYPRRIRERNDKEYELFP